MADDSLLKTILYEFIVNADEAVQQTDRLRSEMEAVKQTFDSLQAKSGESFDVVRKQIESVTVKPITDELKRLRAELSAFESSEFAPLLGDFTGPLKEQIKSLELQLRAIPAAFAEIKKEASLIDEPIRDANVIAQEFTTNVTDATNEMMELVQQGYSLEAAFEGVKGQDLYKSKELTVAKQQVKELVALQQQLNISQQTSEQRAQQFTTNVALAKAEMAQLVQQGYSLQAAMVGLSGDDRFSGKELSQAFKETNQEAKKLGGTLSQTSNIIRRIFAAGAIGFALGAIRKFTQEINEAITVGYELAKSLNQVVVQARILRREGGELLPSDWIKTVKSLSDEFTQFSQDSIAKATSELIRLGRQAGVTDQNIQQLLTGSLTLATIKGLDAAEAANAFATAVESGYARGLKEVIGITDETTLTQEAVKRGLAETTDEVDGNIRAITLLALVNEELIKSGSEVVTVQDSISGKYNEQIQNIDDLKREIGIELIPTKTLLLTVLYNLIIAFKDLSDKTREFGRTIIGYIVTPVAALIALFLELVIVLKGGEASLDRFKQTMEAFAKVFGESLSYAFNLQAIKELSDDIDKVGKAAKGAVRPIRELSDELKDAFIDVRELFIDYYNDLEKIQRDKQQDLIDLEADYANDLYELNIDLQEDISKVWRSYYDDLADANDDYRDKEIEAEEDYQEDLRKLRENFLFDLEDALRERDARQVIRLIRQYNLRKKQLGRDYELDKEQRKRAFKDEQEDLAKQRDIRLRELQIENQQRQAELAREYERERTLREEEAKRRMEEEKIQAKERFDELLRELQDSGTLTEAEANLLSGIYEKVFNDEIPASLDEFINKLEEVAERAGAALLVMQGVGDDVGRTLSEQFRKSSSFLGVESQDQLKSADKGYTKPDIDTSELVKEAQNITAIVEDEIGEEGKVVGLFQYITGKIAEYIQTLLPEAISDKNGTLRESSNNIFDALSAIFGPEGGIEGIFTYLVELIQSAVASVVAAVQYLASALSSINSIKTPTVGASEPASGGGGGGTQYMAKGGTLFANTPTTVTFGEAGPEIAQFTPLSRSQTNVSSIMGGGGTGKSGLAEVLISLSPGLEAEIVNTSLNEVANIIINTNRQRL